MAGETRQQFKELPHQDRAAEAVVSCFEGQPRDPGLSYMIDPGAQTSAQVEMFTGTRNAPVALKDDQLLANFRAVQSRALLPPSEALTRTDAAPINLDIEMETGTGKTYVYIDTMYRLHRDYGWSKFIVVVPSIAIREGVFKTFQDTEAHFQGKYGHKVRRFIYDSSRLEQLTTFSEDRGLHCMIINSQAFTGDVDAAKKAQAGQKAGGGRVIFDTPDKFGSRRPIDVIAANRPILILDEPQRLEGPKVKAALSLFKAPIALRYSATHKTRHDLVHRLDALDAYNAKLVKRIMVRGVTSKGVGGTTGYMVLEAFERRGTQAPRARLHMEVAKKGGEPRRTSRWVERGTNLYELSGGLNQYEGLVVADMHAGEGWLSFTMREPIRLGEIVGTDDQGAVRRVQICETIRAHFERERQLHGRGIKVLSLFFIDEVAKYRLYGEDGEAKAGEYARMFEEEYRAAIEELGERDATDEAWHGYLKRDAAADVHEGYFSIDKKGRLNDPDVHRRGDETGEAKDVDAYDLILKDKGRLLSLDEPVRFVFSHSALREGWDNPNVFQICTLKHSDNEVGKRQEVGRGLRIAVDKDGSRMDGPNVHDINLLTVVASESYEDFAKALQNEMREALRGRPLEANESFFTGKVIQTKEGEATVDEATARKLHRWLVRAGYVDDADRIEPSYHEDKEKGALAPLPPDLVSMQDGLLALVDTVFDPSQAAKIVGNGRKTVTPRLRRENFDKAAFQDLWGRINRKAVYYTDFDTAALINAATRRLDKDLSVPQQQVVVTGGAQRQTLDADAVRSGQGFETDRASTERVGSIESMIRYDLIGRLAAETRLTRRTTGAILKGIRAQTFAMFGQNPETFIKKAADLIRAEKVRLAIERLRYDRTTDSYDATIFTSDQPTVDVARTLPSLRSVFDHVVTDSDTELEFAAKLEGEDRVVVYAKLPRGFVIPTPGGSYNPDWAIAFENPKTAAKHIFFVAETKGSMLDEDLRTGELQRIECASRFFDDVVDGVLYEKIDGYDRLISLIT